MICSLKVWGRNFLCSVIYNKVIRRLYRLLLQNTFGEKAGDLDYCVLRSSPERNPVNIPLRKIEKRRLDKLNRRLLPFYMKPVILIAFMVTSLVGQLTWTTAMAIAESVDARWCGVGFALGIVLGYIQGGWISRMWARDYLRVLKREITFWQAKGATGTTVFVILALGIPIVVGLSLRHAHHLLVGIQSYIFGFIGGMNLALYLWVRRLPK